VETKELILLALQGKTLGSLDAQTWRCALDSVTLGFFYTAKVCIKHPTLHFHTHSLFLHCRRRTAGYIASAYPDLSEDIIDALESMLQSAQYKPLVDDYCQKNKLCSSTAFDQKFASQPHTHALK